MRKLEPPVRRYLTGKLPSHSSTVKLASNYDGLTDDALAFILMKYEYMSEARQPTKKAVQVGLIDVCEKSAIWNLDEVSAFLMKVGFPAKRVYVNQEIEIKGDEPKWVNLGTLGTYFNVKATQVGKWLDELDLRESDGMGNKEALDRGLANVVEMSAGGKKTRKITQWNLYPIQQMLVDAGHPLDFDYDKNLQGTGKNSDVAVESVDERVKKVVDTFLELYNDSTKRNECRRFVEKTPTGLLRKAEDSLKKPGFITRGEYLKNLR